jgi:CheY-like chemotaxis protein
MADKLRMLLVEDDVLIRKLLMSYFDGNVYEFLEAGDGQDALKIALTSRPDVILTDLMMPKLGGAEFIRTLRQMKDFATLPIIALTAGGTDVQAAAKAAGANIVLTKPLKKAQVVSLVEEFLSLTPFIRQPTKPEE